MYCFSSLPADEIKLLIEENPSDPDLRLALMESYMNMDDAEAARVQVSTAAELFPDHAESQIWEAIWNMHDDMQKGRERLEITLHRFSCIELAQRAQREFVPAVMTMAGGSYEQTAELSSIDLSSTDLDEDSKRAVAAATARHGLTILFQQNPASAQKQCADFLASWSRTGQNLQIVARIHQACGLNHKAEKFYREMLANNPAATVAMVDLGYILQDDEEAIKFFQAALENCNFDQRARCGLASRLLKSGRHQKALDQLLRVPADSLFYRVALLTTSQLHQSVGDEELAMSVIEKALVLFPNAPELLEQKGLLDDAEGRKELK